ncbi:MAG: hypothetical protein V9E91_04350 [Burkholderiaceae bacterium]
MKLTKVATFIAAVTVASTAFATGTAVNSDNWRNGSGTLQWKIGNASGLCWRNAGWTPATAAPGCDGAIAAKAAAPAAAVAPVMAAKPAALLQHQPQHLQQQQSLPQHLLLHQQLNPL